MSGQGKDPKRNRSRQRNDSENSSSSSSSSSDSSAKKRRRHKRRNQYSNNKVKELAKEVSELRKLFCRPVSGTPNYPPADNLNFIDHDVSGDLYDDVVADANIDSDIVIDQQVAADAPAQSKFSINLETSVKAPAIPKTPDSYLEALQKLNRFTNKTWTDVRYLDVQKLYTHSPGFVELETNEEVLAYDTSKSLSHTERSYAALTFALLKQKETIENNIREFLDWAQGYSQLTFASIKEKLEGLFDTGEFHKVSVDALQLVCGHRADIVEQRRDLILRAVRDPLDKSNLRKIPPTTTNLFDPQPFAAVLEKAGGVRKVFWPKPKSSTSAPAAQAGNSGNVHRPAQGSFATNMPTQGYQYQSKRRGPPQYTPAQGMCSHYPSQGPGPSNCQQCPAQGTNNGGDQRANPRRDNTTYRPRNWRPNRNGRDTRGNKRSASPSYKDKSNKRRRF
jgi:hypothetical protein